MRGDATIRPATPDDGEAIAQIHVDAWRATYAGIIPDTYLVSMNAGQQRQIWRQTLRGSGRRYPVFVAELVDGEIVGFANCGPARRRMLPRRSPYDGEVYTLYVAPDHQGQGHGSRLLDACFGTLRSQDKTAAVLWVLAANPARFFYEAQGGRKVAERIEKFAGAELEELAFGWDLTA
ncbi:MAG: GNAT family N-acetyltransferase [Alphaproteobacteria bacterium]|nr:GNAT family N-acetyltransferase [Alphaproteobacteria bacterium]